MLQNCGLTWALSPLALLPVRVFWHAACPEDKTETGVPSEPIKEIAGVNRSQNLQEFRKVYLLYSIHIISPYWAVTSQTRERPDPIFTSKQIRSTMTSHLWVSESLKPQAKETQQERHELSGEERAPFSLEWCWETVHSIRRERCSETVHLKWKERCWETMHLTWKESCWETVHLTWKERCWETVHLTWKEGRCVASQRVCLEERGCKSYSIRNLNRPGGHTGEVFLS